MGLDNYQKIINENGNPRDVAIATVGYGVNVQNEIFADRIDENYYNFILDNQDISETIAQGSRIAEVLVDSTTSNIKIMPLVVITEEGYSSIASIAQAVTYATQYSDVICYELINTQNDVIDLVLENAFKENVAVCSVTTSSEECYPANHGMTIAISSINRENLITDYSGKGNYIDFAAPSTDVEEIFNSNSTVSRWSGPQYSNAQIVATIALIKTYKKEATILDVYNFLRNFSIDLGESGKDDLYGYGLPQFSTLNISDIDKEEPKFKEILYDNETWEVLKQIKITAEDNIRIYSWAITQNENIPDNNVWQVLEQVTPNLDVTTEITTNGIYYIWVKDSAGNITKESLQVDKVDNTPPKIAYTIDKNTLSQGYVTINVTAEDTESGLYDNPYSWDKITWSQENSKKEVRQNGRYKVYAKDNLGNISEQEIVVDCFPQEGTYSLGEGSIIDKIQVSSNWNGNTNNDVKIIFKNNLNIVGWQITTSIYSPNDYVDVSKQETVETPPDTTNETENNTITNSTQTIIVGNNDPITITKILDINITYYLWTKDVDGNINYQSFTIAKATI